MLTNFERIRNYGMDIDECQKISPFELIGTLALRDTLEEEYDALTDEEKKMLLENDKKLLDNAKKFYDELVKVYNFQTPKPINNWWAHIDKVVSGELIVDLNSRKVFFRDTPAATRTA